MVCCLGISYFIKLSKVSAVLFNEVKGKAHVVVLEIKAIR